MKFFCLVLFVCLPIQAVDFVKDVRPIFEEHCYSCHSEKKKKSGLRLDVKSAALKGGDNHGPDIIPGNAKESPLIHFLTPNDEDEIMPPKGERLSQKEIDTLTQWVNEGAVWPEGVDRVKLADPRDHWSFKPLQVTPGHHSIDSFIVEKLTENGLKLSKETDPGTWIRRVTFDLIGLPPTPKEIDAFLANTHPNAKDSVVERLLGSPRYGERWAQHWLDVVRYADTHGFEVNTERANAWPFRDYVINAFNRNTPWDQFIKEQIAGDAWGKPEATGFLVTAARLLPGQIGKDEESKRLARQDELGEIVINTGEAFLGLSIGCARCHDHKFDPIPSKDYYAMQAFFGGVEYADREMMLSKGIEARIAALKCELHPIENQLAAHFTLANSGQLRAPVSIRGNVDHFRTVKTKSIRFTVLETMTNNRREPCIDEFEIFGSIGKNLARSKGIKVTASGSHNSTHHQLKFINDGIYGNSRSWMSSEKGKGWVQFSFPETQEISRVIWSRDRPGKYGDRLAIKYRIDALDESGGWISVAESTDRVPFDKERIRGELIQPEDIAKGSGAKVKALLVQQNAVRDQLKKYPKDKQMVFAARSKKPETMHVLNRGDPEQPKGEVVPATLSFLNTVELPKTAGDLDRRKALANWIADPKNPLTARVAVNRIWQWHFGVGLVATANDFGNLGVAPSHPKLLDWLATEFINSGWSVKDLHRRIIQSDTYGQSHHIHSDGLAKDADSRLLWRYPSRRIESEAIRDTILKISGQMDLTMFGPGYDLFASRGGTGGFRPIESHQKAGGRRRLIYAYKVRMEREAVFGAFDCPDAGQSSPRRSQSTTPIQALNLFNSQFTIDLAGDFSNEIQKRVGDVSKDQIREVWALSFGRKPTAEEISDAESMIQKHGLPALCRVIFNTNEFLFLP